MENIHNENYSVIAIGNPSIEILGKVKSSDISKYNLKVGKTNNADKSNIELLENFEKNQDQTNLKYLAGGSALNTIKVINVNIFIILIFKIILILYTVMRK